MKNLFIPETRKILQNKWELEKVLHVKINVTEKGLSVDGESVDEFVAEKVFDAIVLGFPMKDAVLLREEDFVLEILNIKDYTKRHDLETIRARIIGTKRKTLATLEELTGCFFCVKNNSVGIIGLSENIKNAETAVVSLIRGSKQANVYAYLEHHHKETVEDLGIKEVKKKRKKKL